jgi:hypothetical protein
MGKREALMHLSINVIWAQIYGNNYKVIRSWAERLMTHEAEWTIGIFREFCLKHWNMRNIEWNILNTHEMYQIWNMLKTSLKVS